jgi:polyribonucleotide nucleotidyltransferase
VPGTDGLCHISELSDDYVSSVAVVCRVGDMLRVMVFAVDDQDRVKLSRMAALGELAENGGSQA